MPETVTPPPAGGFFPPSEEGDTPPPQSPTATLRLAMEKIASLEEIVSILRIRLSRFESISAAPTSFINHMETQNPESESDSVSCLSDQTVNPPSPTSASSKRLDSPIEDAPLIQVQRRKKRLPGSSGSSSSSKSQSKKSCSVPSAPTPPPTTSSNKVPALTSRAPQRPAPKPSTSKQSAIKPSAIRTRASLSQSRAGQGPSGNPPLTNTNSASQSSPSEGSSGADIPTTQPPSQAIPTTQAEKIPPFFLKHDDDWRKVSVDILEVLFDRFSTSDRAVTPTHPLRDSCPGPQASPGPQPSTGPQPFPGLQPALVGTRIKKHTNIPREIRALIKDRRRARRRASRTHDPDDKREVNRLTTAIRYAMIDFRNGEWPRKFD